MWVNEIKNNIIIKIDLDRVNSFSSFTFVTYNLWPVTSLDSAVYNFATQIIEVILIMVIHAHKLAIDSCNFCLIVTSFYE